MASSAIRTPATTAAPAPATPANAAALIPGILLLAVVGYAGKFIEQFIAHYGKRTTWCCPISSMFFGRSRLA